jgi:hypothetical protein
MTLSVCCLSRPAYWAFTYSSLTHFVILESKFFTLKSTNTYYLSISHKCPVENKLSS